MSRLRLPSSGAAGVRYGIALACAMVAVVVRLGLNPWLHASVPYVTFFPAIVLAARYGLGPGLLATVLCAIGADYVAVEPLYTFRFESGPTTFATAVFVVSGGLASWFSQVLDRRLNREIQEKERTEAALAASHQRTEEVLCSINDAMVAINRQWHYTYVNDQAVQLLQHSREEMLGKCVWDVFPALAGTLSFERLHVVMLERTVERWECHYAPLQLWCEATAYPSQDGIAVYIRDITEQKASALALRESEARLQLALDAANEGFWELDAASGKAYFSPRFLSLLGYASDELPAQYDAWLNLLHPDDRTAVVRQRLEQITRQTGSFVVEYRVRNKGGQYIWIQSRGKVLTRGPDGSPLHVAGTIADITERKTLELQFQHSQRMESVGRLAGGVAHDFNNLLTVINGYAEMLLVDAGSSGPVRESAQEIRSAGERAASLTRQLLAFSRKQILNPTVLNLNGAVRNIEKMLRRLIGEDIQLVTDLAPDLGNITADEGQLQQVILNLAVNARDAMPQGGRLSIETGNVIFGNEQLGRHPDMRPGAHVMLAVSDSGIGMPADVRDRIFEPFFTTKAAGTGTGLGLATVYGIVRQTGGWIWVYSEPGRGATFKVYLPMTEQPVVPAASTAKEASVGNETILVVEDQPDVRQLATTALQRRGYQVHAAACPAEALQFCEHYADPIHLVLTDVVMPDMNGREMADRIKASRPGIRILYMSGYTPLGIAHHVVLDSGVAFLQKPFTPESLGQKVRETLGSPPSPTPTA